MMRRYEVLLLAVPEVTADEAKSIENQIDSQVKTVGGSMILFDRWGKYKLAYPVNKNDYGVYFLARFELPGETELFLKELRSLFTVKLYSVVMRHMFSVLGENVSSVYQRPLSLEEAPVREPGSFYKDRQEGGFSRGPRRRPREQFGEKEFGGESGNASSGAGSDEDESDDE